MSLVAKDQKAQRNPGGLKIAPPLSKERIGNTVSYAKRTILCSMKNVLTRMVS